MHDVQRSGQRISRYETPASLVDALALLERHGPSARLLAGGTDLLLELARGVRPGVDVLVDLSRVAGLDTIEERDGVLHLGPLVTHNQIVTSDVVISHALPLAQACLEVGSPALRNRATVVGNLVTASPANDTISALMALGTTLVVRRASSGQRRIKLEDFFTGVRRTVLEDGEIITSVEVRTIPVGERGVFVKLGQRRAQAISIVHLGAVIALDDNGMVTEARLALGSVAPTVLRVAAVEEYLLGGALDDNIIRQAGERAAAAVHPIDDVRASAAYRRDLVAVVVRRALTALRDGAQRDAWPAHPPTLGASVASAGSGESAVAGFTHEAATPIVARVNGAAVERTPTGGPGRTLLDWLRDDVGLTGTKEGCAEGECGACTLNMDGAAVLACLVAAPRAQGAVITTVEGLASDGALGAVQQAFVDQFAVQCGFCIPGFVVAADRLLAEFPTPTREQIAHGLSGNLCRCTGYYRIYDAVEQAARQAVPRP